MVRDIYADDMIEIILTVGEMFRSSPELFAVCS